MKAPFLKEQANEPFSDMVALIGSQAFSEWGKGKGVNWLNLCEYGLKQPPSQKPVIIDKDQLANLAGLEIAPKEQRFIKFFQCGELKQQEITALCLNLAKNQPKLEVAELCDIITGKHKGNLSSYINQLKKDKDVATRAEMVAEAQSNESKDTLAPYYAIRKERGKTGLYYVIPELDTKGEIKEKLQRLSSPLSVVGYGQADDESYYTVIQYDDLKTQKETLFALPMSDIGERSGWSLLRGKGITITNNNVARNYLADYLMDCCGKKPFHVTNVTGWQKGAYILPSGEVIGEPEAPVYFVGKSASRSAYKPRGTLEQWQAEIADKVRLNSSMMLAVACSLSSPLISLINAESFGVHLFGGSSTGKTTTANIASSIWGEPDEIRLSWNGTGLGIANEAQARNDGFLPIDEIGQATNKKHVSDIAYTLFNGVGKIQGHKDGGNRDVTRWRTLAFSTGEMDIESYLAVGGINIQAGQLVRLLNIPITQAKHFHSLKDGKAHADHLNEATRSYYGTVGREWVKLLIQSQQQIKPLFDEIKGKWLDSLPSDCNSQVKRVAVRFAVLETALQLAKPLTKWTTEENHNALKDSFVLWVDEYGLHSREEKRIIEQAIGFLQVNTARFSEYPFNHNQAEPSNKAGYRILGNTDKEESEIFYIFPTVYKSEVIKGFNEKQASEILANAQILKKGKDKGYPYMVRLPHKIDTSRTRCYMLTIPNDEEEDTEE